MWQMTGHDNEHGSILIEREELVCVCCGVCFVVARRGDTSQICPCVCGNFA
jgi:hypothetical protein